MCDKYYGSNDDIQVSLDDPIKAWKVVRQGLVGLYQGRYNVVEDSWLRASHDPIRRLGFHGFCSFATKRDAVSYAKYARTELGYDDIEIVKILIAGNIKQARTSKKKNYLSEFIMFPSAPSSPSPRARRSGSPRPERRSSSTPRNRKAR